MRNCLVTGSGRGGTSLLAGTIARAGYYAGAELHEARPTNPRGFYEDAEINNINEAMLAPLTPQMPQGTRWLAALPLEAPSPEATPDLDARIEAQVAREPFCFKDPRYCYTLDAWRPHVGDAALLCVFRPPLVTARSIVKEVAAAAYLAALRPFLTVELALEVWTRMHRWLLERQARSGKWLFVHYDQLLDGSAFDAIEDLLQAPVDRTFADPRLNRTAPQGEVPPAAAEVYAALCERAGFAPAEPEAQAARRSP